jgi:2-polyprenyl-3-methyl-5-hydroxy-6-metoxy-1,4-benzoquinol methylase
MHFAPHLFDLVTANPVVEHVPDPERFLRSVHEVLKPGGRLLFHTTNFSNYLVRGAPTSCLIP